MSSRITIVAVSAAGILLVALAGCADTASSLFGGSTLPGRPVETPDVPEASIGVAARVDQVGRELLAANPFLGVDPVFHTVADKKPVLLHPDLNGVIISEGLVERCPTDDDLAAVLAAELGQMAAEKRVAAARSERPPLPVNLPDGSNQNYGGIPSDQTHLAELASYERRNMHPAGPARSGREMAAEVLRSSGRDAARLDALAGLIEDAQSSQSRFGSLGGRPAAPKWSQ